MLNATIALFLIAHGLLHLTIYVVPRNPHQRLPYDASRSWALQTLHVGTAPMHTAAVALSSVVATLYCSAGLALDLRLGAAAGLAAAAAVTALALKVVWFNTWLTLGVAIDLAILLAVATGWPPSLL
jgi:hypothetical protein